MCIRDRVKVRYKGNGEFGVMTSRELRTGEETEAEKVKFRAERERGERLKAFMAVEQREALEAEEKRRKDRAEQRRVRE